MKTQSGSFCVARHEIKGHSTEPRVRSSGLLEFLWKSRDSLQDCVLWNGKFRMTLVRRFRRLVIYLLLLCFVGSIGLLYWISNKGAELMLYPRRAEKDAYHQGVVKNPESYGFELHPFSVVRENDVVLEAMYLKAKLGTGQNRRKAFVETVRSVAKTELLEWSEQRGTLVMLHGRNSMKEHWFPIAEKLSVVGFDLILLDSRAHGASGGVCTYGKDEVGDVKAAVEQVRQQFGMNNSVGVMGYSLGGAVAARLVREEAEFKAVVMVSVFSSLAEMTQQVGQNRYGELTSWVMPAVRQQVKWRADFDLEHISPAQWASEIRIPAFVIHGAEDQFVAPSHGEKIFAALPCADKRWRLVNDAGHADLFVKAGDDLIIEIAEFFAQHLK